MHKFVRNLITEWRRLELPFSDSAIVVAVSGGTDSNSLLLALHDLTIRKKLGHRIVVAHFNHLLRAAESDADEESVRQMTVKLGIEFAVGHAKLQKDGNLEQNARDARYQFLIRTAKAVRAFAVLTGHTVNDQAETFLINLIRGSGPDGLSGMRPVRVLDEETPDDTTSEPLLFGNTQPLLLVRPLLKWAKRRDTEGFCHDLGVECCHDAMNDDTAFRRVRIRKVLLPLLEDFNPKIVDTLAQTAELMQNLSNSSESGNHSGVADELILGEVKMLPKPELYETLRTWLRHHRGNTRQLQLQHIEAIERLIFSEKSGRTAELPGGARVIKSAGRLVYDENKVEY
ncbi:MAG: tRNA lysidine(34) synthetase TilS [Acidobacteriota bacterium]